MTEFAKKYFSETVLKIFSVSIAVIIFSSGCTQPIAFKNLIINQPGYFQFGKTKERNFFENVAVKDSLQLLWSSETTGSQSYTSVAIYDYILFVSDLSGRIYAFDRVTGKSLGYEKYNGAIPITPVISNLRIFFVVNDLNERYSTLKQFDFLGGKILSQSKIMGSVQNEMLKFDDGIVVLNNNGLLTRFNLIGVKEWSVSTDAVTKSSPASTKETILFGNLKGEVIAVSAKTGEIKYRKNLSKGIEGGICIDGQTAFFGDNKGKLFSVNILDGKVKWQFDSKNKILATPVHFQNFIIFGNLAGEIFCLNKNDGKLIWKTETDGVINTTPVLFKNFLVQPDLAKKIYMIDIQNGKIKKTLNFPGRVKLSPIYYDGILYIGADRGIINAYKIFPVD